MNNVIQNSSVGVITLKDLTDLISVRHDKAMIKVEALSKEPSFGLLSKMDIVNLNGLKVATYSLTKKQAIAVGARLNNSLLMKVIDKVDELEKAQTQKVLSTSEQIILIAQGHQEIDQRLLHLEATKRLESWQEASLSQAKNRKVYILAGVNHYDKKYVAGLHRKVWSLFKKNFFLPRYNELPAVKYQDGLDFINNLAIADMV